MSAQIAKWNLKKANWSSFSKDLDSIVKWIPRIPESYSRFTKAIISSAKRNIPRGYRKEYTPGWNDQCEDLLAEYKESRNKDVAKALLDALNDQRKKSWMEKTEGLNFTHSSRKACGLIKRLGSTKKHTSNLTIKPTVNNIAEHFVKLPKGTVDKQWSKQIKTQLRKEKRNLPYTSETGKKITLDELETALTLVKRKKLPGLNGVLPEFLLNLEPAAKRYLTCLYSSIIKTGRIPKQFKETKIVVLKKSGKEGNDVTTAPSLFLAVVSNSLNAY